MAISADIFAVLLRYFQSSIGNLIIRSIIAVEMTNSSATQNHVLFQPTSEQAKYGASGNLKKKSKGFCSFPSRLIISGFFVENKLFYSFNTVYCSLSCKQSYKKTCEAQS